MAKKPITKTRAKTPVKTGGRKPATAPAPKRRQPASAKRAPSARAKTTTAPTPKSRPGKAPYPIYVVSVSAHYTVEVPALSADKAVARAKILAERRRVPGKRQPTSLDFTGAVLAPSHWQRGAQEPAE